MENSPAIPVLGFAAYSGTGKTSLLVRLLPLLGEKGIRVGVIKHAHHTFDIDHEGKDSYELRKAGAKQMLIGSDRRWALIVETEKRTGNILNEFIRRLDHANLDLILVEGFKPEIIAKIELIRPSLGHSPFYPEDKSIIAVATDGDLPVKTKLPILDLNNPQQIADFIIARFINQQQIHTGT